MILVKPQWATPDIDAQIAGLLNYCMREAAPVTAGAFFPSN